MRKAPLTYKKQIAPRLAGGLHRDKYGGGLPPAIKEGLRMQAYRERKSMSYLLEEVVIAHFNMDKPEYVSRKANEEAVRTPEPKKKTKR